MVGDTMAGTQLFKNTSRNVHRKRYMTDEDQFSKGMQYTNEPLGEGYAKAIINFDLKNDGVSLVPRGGLNIFTSSVCNISAAIDVDYIIHHADATYVLDYQGKDAALCNYFILCKRSVNTAAPDLSTAKLMLEHNNHYYSAAYDTTAQNALTGKLLMKPPIAEMHGLTISDPIPRDGIHASLEGNTYVLIDTTTSHKLGRLIIKFDNQYENSFKWHIEEVTAKEVQPTQAMNYGYNMLKAQPYTFSNTVSSTGAVQLTGVLPYDEVGNLLLTARPGTPMVFKLFYKYPQADIDNADKYLVQWEIQDLNSNVDAEVIHKVRGSQQYTPGDDIQLAYTPSFTAFSLIVRLYKKSEMDAQDAAWENDTVLQNLVTKDDNLTPNQVTTLASYYLTNNSDTSMLNVDPVVYDLGTATGICTWQHRLVMWGVTGAKSTLFVSEINDPSYMPYPNNCDIFDTDIICAIPYMSALLVFTTTSLYKLTINDDGLSYTTERIQDRLNMTPADANTVVAVQNMVYFKSGNYFYMIVPNKSLNAASNVQLAPVSRMVEQMFDNIGTVFARTLNELYNLSFDDYRPYINISLVDYNVQLGNNQIRNIYKLAVDGYKSNGATEFFDVSLNYDTVLRAWTMYVYQTNYWRDVVYKPTVTGENILVHLYQTASTIESELIQADPLHPADSVTLDFGEDRKYGNWQFIDTGYRDFQEDLKKRFREVQFCINILSTDVLKFNTAFVVDDIDRVPLYKHIVSQITDPLDVNYGIIFVDRELISEVETPEITEFNDWELNTAMFPDITMHKIRYKVSGKGYGGAVKILSKNEIPFELLHINWVYRIMFAR